MNKLYFFLSTGRCGTTWMCRSLRDIYSDLAISVHEPVKKKHRLGGYYLKNDENLIPEDRRLPNNELREIEEEIHHVFGLGKNLNWVGWDCYALIPFLAPKFEGKVKIIHLKRNKDACVKSLKRARFYPNSNHTSHPNPKLHDSLIEISENFEEDTQSWYYDEIHKAYPKYLKKNFPNVPFLDFRSEYVFDHDEEKLRKLIDFLELPWRKEFLEASHERRSMLWPNSRGIKECINPKITMK